MRRWPFEVCPGKLALRCSGASCRSSRASVSVVRRPVKVSWTLRVSTDQTDDDAHNHSHPDAASSLSNYIPLCRTMPKRHHTDAHDVAASAAPVLDAADVDSQPAGLKKQRTAADEQGNPQADVLFDEYLKHRAEFLTFIADKPRRDRALAEQRRCFDDMGRAQRAAFNSLGRLIFEEQGPSDLDEQCTLEELQLRKEWPEASLRVLVEGQVVDGTTVNVDDELMISGGGHPAALQGKSLVDFFKHPRALSYIYAAFPDRSGLCCLVGRYFGGREPCCHSNGGESYHDNSPSYSPTSPGRAYTPVDENAAPYG
jgi:hypothetical protein